MAWEKLENIRGPKGEKGEVGSVQAASIASLPPGSAATVTLSGKDTVHMHLGIPRGDKGERGPAGSVASASAESVAAGEQAEAILSGTDEVKHLKLLIPRGLPGAEAMPTAEAVGEYLAAPDSPSQPGFDSGAARLVAAPSSELRAAVVGCIDEIVDPASINERLDGFRFDVTRFGALRDGVSDDTAAVQAAIDKAGVFGGTVYFPPGEYYMDSYAALASNISIVGDSATIKKTAQSTSYACFASLSGSQQGYGSGCRNVTVRGLRFRGSFTPGSERAVCGFALHHAENFLAENLEFVEASGAGHQFDLNGCDGVTIRNCTWRGFKQGMGTAYTESIQLDRSGSGGMSVQDATLSYDGLHTQNVLVEGCRFLPLTLGVSTYPAPIPLGSHSLVSQRWYKNIAFVNNTVSSVVPLTSGQNAGMLHFVAVDGLLVQGNTFINSEAVAGYVMQTSVPAEGDTMETIAVPGSVPIPEQACKNIKILDNSFIGFGAETAVYAMRIAGSAGAKVQGVVFSGNSVDSKAGAAETAPFAHFAYVEALAVRGNSFKATRRALRASFCDTVTVSGNTAEQIGEIGFYFAECGVVTFSGNAAQGFHAPLAQADKAGSLTVSGNTCSGHDGNVAAIRVVNVDRLSATGNVLQSETQRPAGVSVVGSAGIVVGNAFLGYGVPFSADAASTIVTSGNA